MWRQGFRWMWVIAAGSVLGLVAVQAAPDVAQAGSVEVVSHGWHGSGGAWGGGTHWGRRDHDAWAGHDRWGARHDHWRWHHWRWRDHGPRGSWSPWHAPVHIPPRWVWNGYGWVLVPGDWR